LKEIKDHINIVVADDEALARKRIVKFIIESEVNCSIIETSTGTETIKALTTESPDLVFLDIQMTDMTGFNVLEQIPASIIPIIVFVTAFDMFAVKAFEVQAIDFLLKPYKKKRFIDAFQRALRQIEMKGQDVFKNKMLQLMHDFSEHKKENRNENNTYLSKVVLKKNKKYYFIQIEEIIYIKSSSYYAEIYTKNNEKHIYRISMSDFILKLNPDLFARINRGTIINIQSLKEIVSEGMGDYSLVMNDGSSFALTKKYKDAFLKKSGIKES